MLKFNINKRCNFNKLNKFVDLKLNVNNNYYKNPIYDNIINLNNLEFFEEFEELNINLA